MQTNAKGFFTSAIFCCHSHQPRPKLKHTTCYSRTEIQIRIHSFKLNNQLHHCHRPNMQKLRKDSMHNSKNKHTFEEQKLQHLQATSSKQDSCNKRRSRSFRNQFLNFNKSWRKETSKYCHNQPKTMILLQQIFVYHPSLKTQLQTETNSNKQTRLWHEPKPAGLQHLNIQKGTQINGCSRKKNDEEKCSFSLLVSHMKESWWLLSLSFQQENSKCSFDSKYVHSNPVMQQTKTRTPTKQKT